MNGSWDTLVATALMGTDRQTPNLSEVDGALGDLLGQMTSTDAESSLLGAAGAIATYYQAGTVPDEQTISQPNPCDGDQQPYCSALALQLLNTMLNGKYRPVLSEFLVYLNAAGQRVPEELLPTLLNIGRQQSHLRDLIQPGIGKRGTWLAQQNPDWAYISSEVDMLDADGHVQTARLKERWETGTRATRLALLKELRAIAPDQAREQLSATWTQEKAKDRAAFLGQFLIGLSLEDEAFLESALGDRSKEVRAIAAHMLAHLPESQLCQRMTERATTFLKIQPSSDSIILNVMLPDSPDQSWQKDGIVAEKRHGLGQRGSLLMQLLSAVPLKVWEPYGDANVLIEAASQHEWKRALLKGWEIAAQRQQNQAWIQALVTGYLQGIDAKDSLDLSDLLTLLPIAKREEMLARWLTRLWQSEKRESWCLQVQKIAQSQQKPSLEFSRLLLAGLQVELTEGRSSNARAYPYQLRSLAESLAYYLDPHVTDEADAFVTAVNLDDLDPYRKDLLTNWLEILTFRQQVSHAFVDDCS